MFGLVGFEEFLGGLLWGQFKEVMFSQTVLP